MDYSITWTLRNIPRPTRERARIMAAVLNMSMTELVSDAIMEFMTHHRQELERFYTDGKMPPLLERGS